MSASRRLAAVLAADVVGYSRLMGEDEPGTAKAVRERRDAAQPIVANLGGRILKTTGDGVLLEFSSVVAAVECAIAIQKLMAERNTGLPEGKCILYRVGVNLGDVLVEGDDIVGDGVNIAARLEGICEPGRITDARFSGASWGWLVGHVTPEAAVGGTIALVKNGDLITLDSDKGLIQLGVTAAEIKRRRASWKPRKPRYKDGVLAEYAAHVSSASEGAILT